MGETQRKSGKKGRKIGRQKKKPAHIRYTMERRWEKNKERRAKKVAKILARKAARKARREAERG